MISSGSTLEVSDNSGAKIAQCIQQSGRSWGIGDTITVAIKKAATKGKVAAGSVQKAVITETKKQLQRKDGSVVKFHKNACVLVNSNGQPIGTRVLGFATHELRARQMLKILSLASRGRYAGWRTVLVNMSKARDAFNLTVFGLVGLGTLAGVLLTSQTKKVAAIKNREASFEEKMAAFERKE
ncbi:g5620 [Coccomyxa elongata]